MKILNLNSQEELKTTLNQVLRELNDTITTELEFKQAKLLTYWLNDWNERFLKAEKNFNPTDLIKYKRGNVVNAHLGYNIGSEEGGLHYGLVLDVVNDKNSSVITILPLRSLKPDENPEDINGKFEVYLGDSLLVDKIEYTKRKLEKAQQSLLELNKDPHKSLSDSIKLEKIINRCTKELENLNKGTVAIVSQIRTISKLRIYEPTKSFHSLSKFVLDSENMNKIDIAIKELFLK